MERMITLKKRMAATWGLKKQMIGSGYINRSKGGKEADASPDCMWVDPMLPGLKYKENEVEVEMTVSLDEFKGSTPMWVFMKRPRSRMLCVGRKPEFVECHEESETWKYQGSAIYLDNWCQEVYFKEITQVPFRVYVSVKRKDAQS